MNRERLAKMIGANTRVPLLKEKLVRTEIGLTEEELTIGSGSEEKSPR